MTTTVRAVSEISVPVASRITGHADRAVQDNSPGSDWPHARIGAAWLDVVGFAPSVTMQGGPAPDVVLARSAAGRNADPDAVNAGIATVAGYFTRGALQPPPPGLPTVRAFQAAQGVVA